jgi:hypothetical protein
MGKKVAHLAGGIDGIAIGGDEGEESESSVGSGGVIGAVATLETSVAGNMGTDSSGSGSSTTSTTSSMLGRAANAVSELENGCARGAERTVVLRAQLSHTEKGLVQLGEQFTSHHEEVGDRLGVWERAAEAAASTVANVSAEQRECMLRIVAAKQQDGHLPEGREDATGGGCFDEHAAKASKKAREWCETQAAAGADLIRRIHALEGLAAAARREQETHVAAAKTEVRGCVRVVVEGVGHQLHALQVSLQAASGRCQECVAEHKIDCCTDPVDAAGATMGTGGGAIGLVVESYLEEEGAEAGAATARATAVLHEFEAQRRDQVSKSARVAPCITNQMANATKQTLLLEQYKSEHCAGIKLVGTFTKAFGSGVLLMDEPVSNVHPLAQYSVRQPPCLLPALPSLPFPSLPL